MRTVVLATLVLALLASCGRAPEVCTEVSLGIVGPWPDNYIALSGPELLARRTELDSQYVVTVGTLMEEERGEPRGSSVFFVFLEESSLKSGWQPGAVQLALTPEQTEVATEMSGSLVSVLGLFRARPPERSNAMEPAGVLTRVIALQRQPSRYPVRERICAPSGLSQGS